jgi:hypothetical protein
MPCGAELSASLWRLLALILLVCRAHPYIENKCKLMLSGETAHTVMYTRLPRPGERRPFTGCATDALHGARGSACLGHTVI